MRCPNCDMNDCWCDEPEREEEAQRIVDEDAEARVSDAILERLEGRGDD